jgi:hypothetical protein
MFVLDAISAIEFDDGELRIDFADGDVDRYRIRDGQLVRADHQTRLGIRSRLRRSSSTWCCTHL